MAKTNEIQRLQADLRENPELASKINSSILDILIDLLKVLGYDISMKDLEEAIKVEGASTALKSIFVWSNYFIV